MENRIEINGVWYVREDAINDSLDHLEAEEIDLTFFEGCVYETSEYCFEASRIFNEEDKKFYPGVDIKFIDKRNRNRDTWKEEHWDNDVWFKGILKNHPESLKILEEMDMCFMGRNYFKLFLKRLVKEGWLEK